MSREIGKGKCRIEESPSSLSSSSGIIPSFPDEIIEDIILRLPTKSLVRFTSVSKRWRSLISHPNFTKNHLNRLLLDQSNNHQRLLVRSYHSPSTFYSTDYDSINSIPVNRNFPPLAPRGIEILGSCNGLFLVRLNKESLYLWNPSFSREFRRLPTSNCFSEILGFGYDSSIDDYKVVRVVNAKNNFPVICFLDHKVEVYNLKTESWRRIPDIPNCNIIFPYQEVGTLVNGSLYWRITIDGYGEHPFGQNDEQELLLAFDLANEKFRLVPFPEQQVAGHWRSPFRQVAGHWGSPLSVVRGSLAVVYISRESHVVVVWTLKEDGEKNEFSWTKLMETPNEGDECTVPLCSMKSGEFLFSLHKKKRGFVEDRLVIYDEKTFSFRKYFICGSSFWLEEHMYMETLVSPNGV